ncbi:SDR family oxidoreductase [Candidatus Curtissbacteria bacterium]|nr:SDR family oxidoreductase [Candidatus Curtissbacteria bacterium]
MRTAIVSGSAKGLGKSIALALAKEGYVLAIHYRDSADAARKTFQEVKKISQGSILLQADMTREDEVLKMADETLAKLGRVDLLVNNVGNFIYKDFGKTSNSEFRDLIESNLYSTLFASRAVLPCMRKQKSGHIVNIGAVGAERLQILEKSTPYFLAKTGVYILTKIMAHEEAKNGIHINMISPGSLATDIFKAKEFPMGRAASYHDVTRALLFLISGDAYYINGANIEVSGGYVPGFKATND